MKIGILGDTHDHLPNIQRAVERLKGEDLDLCLHTGDYIAPFVIPVLAGLGVRIVGVFGNNDGDRELLGSRCRDAGGIEIRGNFAELEEAGIRIALLHGHEKTLLADLIESELFDLVVHGHTHQAGITRKGRTLVVNPGEICGYLTGNPTCAIFDTEAGQARLIPL